MPALFALTLLARADARAPEPPRPVAPQTHARTGARDPQPDTEAGHRLAWLDPRTRDAAAEALRSMYDRGELAPSIDARTLASTRRTLGADFLLTETRNFVVLSDADQAWTRGRAAMLERARHQFFRVMDRLEVPVYPPEHKLLCILINDFEHYRAFAEAEDGVSAGWVAGYYSPKSNRIVFYNDSTSPAFEQAATNIETARAKLAELRARAAQEARAGRGQDAAVITASADEFEGRIRREQRRLDEAAANGSCVKTVHEAIHLLAFNTGLQLRMRDYPFWLSEGLAACFETDDAGSAFGPEHPSAERVKGFEAAAVAGTLIPLDRLVCMTEAPAEDANGNAADGAEAKVMYDQSRALFAYLYRYRRKELGAYFRAFLAEPATRLGPERQKSLFEAAFGKPEALERRLKTN